MSTDCDAKSWPDSRDMLHQLRNGQETNRKLEKKDSQPSRDKERKGKWS